MLTKIRPYLLCSALCVGLGACGGATDHDHIDEPSLSELYIASYEVVNNSNSPLVIELSGRAGEDTTTLPVGESARVHEELTACCKDDPAAAFDIFTIAAQLDHGAAKLFLRGDDWTMTEGENGAIDYSLSVTDATFYGTSPELSWKGDAPSLIHAMDSNIYRYYYENATAYDIVADFEPWSSQVGRYTIKIPAGETKLVLELGGECCEHTAHRAFIDLTLYTPLENDKGSYLQGLYGVINGADWEAAELTDTKGFDGGTSYTLGLSTAWIESVLRVDNDL